MNRIWMIWLLALAAWAHAAPPALDIDSMPLAAACKPGKVLAGQASGPMLLRPQPVLSTTSAPAASAGDLYQATMDVGDWSGHFFRYVLPAGAAGIGGASALAWDAGAILTGDKARPPQPLPMQREIYTAIVQPGGALMTVPFEWAALSAEQQALLNLADNAGEQRLAYLRGERSLEGRPFRQRSSVLGDSVHSTPIYVGAVDHREAVYLGANDGMLHAFDALSGVELFAYVPDALIDKLPHLASSAYVHEAYVDGPASVGDIHIGGEKKKVLVSAMGGGARGVFALDITDPAHFADGLGALWEFTERDDPLMGNVLTMPQIAQVRLPSSVRPFAIVASGINNDGEGKGALFLLALDKPASEGWKLNGNYYRITTPISDDALANALSAPVLLNDGDGALQYAYAGDLQGNLWRFDFSGKAPWPKAIGKPLFVAKDARGRRQPITEQPLLAFAKVRGYVLLFGTGSLIEKADRSTSVVTQTYYGVIDSLQTPREVISGRSQLTQRFLDGGGARMDVESKGWYIDFLPGTERSINAGVLADGAVMFNTVLPGADMCSATHSRSYVLNALTGLPDDGRFTAVLPSGDAVVGLTLPDYVPMPLRLPQSVVHGSPDPTGRITQTRESVLVQVGAAGQVTPIGSIQSTRRVGRLSWREVANWRELHEAAK